MINKEFKRFLNLLVDMYNGRRIWRRILKQYAIDLGMDFVILLPAGNRQCNYYCLLYINKLIEQFERRKNFLAMNNVPIIRRNEKIFIISNDEEVIISSKVICRRVSEKIFLDDQDIKKIIRYYCMFPFTDRLIVGILEGIPGRSGLPALEDVGFSIEELVANGIYDMRMSKFDKRTRPRIPRCYGCDDRIRKFIRDNDMRICNE